MPIDRVGVTKEDIAKGYDAIAEKVKVSDDFYNEVLDIQGTFCGDILEIGVGQGHILKQLLLRSGDTVSRIVGIDLSEKLMAMARTLVPRATILAGDAESLPFADESFDFVLMVDIFQYLLDPDKALQEVQRVLRPNGIFLVTVPNRDWILFKNYIRTRKNIQPVEDRFFTYHEMKALLEKHHFFVSRYTGADAFRYYPPYHRYERWLALFFPWMHRHMKKIVFRVVKPKAPVS